MANEWKRLMCLVFGHQFAVVKEFYPDQRMVGCKRCCRIWAMHDGVRAFVPWDGDFTRLYSDRGLL